MYFERFMIINAIKVLFIQYICTGKSIGFHSIMRTNGNPIPLSTSLGGFYRKALERRKTPVNKRVFYLSIQVIFNALVIGVVAKGLV